MERKYRIKLIKKEKNLLKDVYIIEERINLFFFSLWRTAYETDKTKHIKYPLYFDNIVDAELKFYELLSNITLKYRDNDWEIGV